MPMHREPRGEASPLASSHPVTIAWMKGRSRAYKLNTRGSGKTAISVVYNERCDMIAATAELGHDRPDIAELRRGVSQKQFGDALGRGHAWSLIDFASGAIELAPPFRHPAN